MIRFTNERTRYKPKLPIQYFKRYTTRKLVPKANDKGHEEFLGEPIVIDTCVNYIGTKEVTSAALRKSRLAQTLYLEINVPVMLFQNVNVIYGWVNGVCCIRFDCYLKIMNVDGQLLRFFIGVRRMEGKSCVFWMRASN